MKKILVNLKDWFNLEENKEFASKLNSIDAVIFPSLPYLYLYKEIDGITLGAQDISSESFGAHTGVVSAGHLKEFGVEWVILNHKELKIESSDTLYNKIRNAKNEKMKIVLCIDGIGEDNISFLVDTLNRLDDYENIYIAYEPSEESNISVIKSDINTIKKGLLEVLGYSFSMYYGGNINLDNIKDYNDLEEIDGLIISRSALDSDNLKTIINLVK